MERPIAPEWWESELQTESTPTLRTVFGWLTLEVAAYAIVFLLGLFLRVAGLESRPVSPSEAQTAFAAWQFSQGQPPGAFSSPLVFTLDWLAFFLLGATDLTARLLPALFGSFVVLVPAP